MNRDRGSHPDDGDLLRYADGELSSGEEQRIRAHLAACWQCRTELAEIQRTIGECVHYRKTVLHEHLPEPPSPWPDIYRSFDAFEESRQRPSWAAQFWGSMRNVVLQPRRWSAAVAMALVVFLIVDHLRNAPSVRAAELLEQASAVEESGEVENQWVRISTENGAVTRTIFDGSVASPPQEDAETLDELRTLFEEANYDWHNPLSAAAFAAWRDGLDRKRDEVTTLRGEAGRGSPMYRIRTTTDSNVLTEATLMLAVNGLDAIEGTLRFRDYGLVEMTPAEAPPAPSPAAEELAASATVPVPDAPEPLDTHQPVAELATPAEELQIFALLHRLGADLGEPVNVTREAGQVIVSGVGVSPLVGERIEDELAALDDVRVQFSEPVPVPPPSQMTPSPTITTRPEIEQLQLDLENRLGGRAVYEQFVDDLLRSSDALMARVHALRRLAEQFPENVESQLSDEDRQLLARLRHEHAVALLEHAVALEQRSRMTLGLLGAEQPSPQERGALPGTWQDATQTLLADAREAESLIAELLGGTASSVPASQLPGAALASFSRLRTAAAQYARRGVE